MKATKKGCVPGGGIGAACRRWCSVIDGAVGDNACSENLVSHRLEVALEDTIACGESPKSWTGGCRQRESTGALAVDGAKPSIEKISTVTNKSGSK